MSADRFKRPDRLLSYSERQALERAIQREEAYLGNKIDVGAAKAGDTLARMPERQRLYIESISSYDAGLGDNAAVMLDIRQKRRKLAAGMPDSIGEAEKAALEKEARELEEFLKPNMSSRKMLSLPYGHQDFQKAVHLGLREQSPEFSERAMRWKNIKRQLIPDDPSASNLETIRPEN